MSESPNMNLIPVDQPVIGSASTGVVRVKSMSPPMARSSPTGEQHQDSGTRQSEQAVVYHTTGGNPEPTLTTAESNAFTGHLDASVPETTVTVETDTSEPTSTARHGAQRGLEGAVDGADTRQRTGSQHQQIQSQLADSSVLDSFTYGAPLNQREHFAANQYPIQQQQQQIVERRFGLFKKQQHYGSPMSASYSANPYMTDCERCLASLSQQSADLQQLDPVPAPLPVPQPQPAPLAPIMPPSQPSFSMQPFGPLKNKLFMKFPFFMKPMSFGEASYGSHGDAVPYWHQYQPQPQLPPVSRPQTSGALYIRPAQAAYNCIQATPPLIPASNGHQDQVAQFAKTSQSKQYPQQQQQQQQQISYPNSQY